MCVSNSEKLASRLLQNPSINRVVVVVVFVFVVVVVVDDEFGIQSTGINVTIYWNLWYWKTKIYDHLRLLHW